VAATTHGLVGEFNNKGPSRWRTFFKKKAHAAVLAGRLVATPTTSSSSSSRATIFSVLSACASLRAQPGGFVSQRVPAGLPWCRTCSWRACWGHTRPRQTSGSGPGPGGAYKGGSRLKRCVLHVPPRPGRTSSAVCTALKSARAQINCERASRRRRQRRPPRLTRPARARTVADPSSLSTSTFSAPASMATSSGSPARGRVHGVSRHGRQAPRHRPHGQDRGGPGQQQ
jgi:hypothetical protein